jgi:hypothetical protein
MSHSPRVIDDSSADPLSDVGNKGVSEGLEADHPLGNPISHSQTSGWIGPGPTRATKFRHPGHFIIEGEVWFVVSVGVANQPDAGALMRRIEVGCAKHSPRRIEPELGQVAEYLSESPSGVEESLDVLHEDVAGSKTANDVGVVGPHPGCVVASAGGLALTGAGEPAGENVDSRDGVGVDLTHVGHARHVRPVSGEDATAELVDLALPAAGHACSLEAEVPSADSREEAAESEGLMRHAAPSRS